MDSSKRPSFLPIPRGLKHLLIGLFATSLLSGAGFAKERGFETGQTLPDIALVDLEGKEVRFSDFLGKRYVLYGWASW